VMVSPEPLIWPPARSVDSVGGWLDGDKADSLSV
jgi:hypothetical protein